MEERTEIESRLEALRQDRGAAQLDGGKIDKINAAIASAELELAALDDAGTVRIAREREQARKDAQVALKSKMGRVVALEVRRLDAWAELEKATRAQLEAIGKVISATESARVLLHDITQPTPHALGSFETKHRIRGRINEFLHAANVDFEIVGARGLYGQAPVQDWKDAERKSLVATIEHLREEFEDNGNQN